MSELSVSKEAGRSGSQAGMDSEGSLLKSKRTRQALRQAPIGKGEGALPRGRCHGCRLRFIFLWEKVAFLLSGQGHGRGVEVSQLSVFHTVLTAPFTRAFTWKALCCTDTNRRMTWA